jgi:hypothetical protein
MEGGSVLTEDDVIDGVRDELKSRGWELVRRATANQRGNDLVMRLDGESLVVEAKGAGSSKPGTARFGKEFDKGQVFDHVAKAILKALRVSSAGEARAGVALPDNEDHRREIDRVRPALTSAGIIVFWVAADRSVSTDGDDEWLT